MAQNGPLKNFFLQNSAGITSSTVTSTPGLSGEVSSALQSLPIIQQSLQDIQHRLNGLKELRSELQSVKESLLNKQRTQCRMIKLFIKKTKIDC